MPSGRHLGRREREETWGSFSNLSFPEDSTQIRLSCPVRTQLSPAHLSRVLLTTPHHRPWLGAPPPCGFHPKSKAQCWGPRASARPVPICLYSLPTPHETLLKTQLKCHLPGSLLETDSCLCPPLTPPFSELRQSSGHGLCHTQLHPSAG